MAGRRGRKAVVVELADGEREELEGVVRRGKSRQDLVLRCKIVLAAADGMANVDIAGELGCSPATASKWRKRFVEQRVFGLDDAPRSGAPRTITDEMVDKVVVKTLEETPANATHWSKRSMAAAVGMSPSAIHRIWRAFGLKPHLVEEFKVSPDPHFVDKVRDITALYLNPPDAAVVLCVDEKTQIQAMDRTAPVLPLMPGVPQRFTHDYRRHGTTNLYTALDTASGKVITHMTARTRAKEFIKFLNIVDKQTPEHIPQIHIVLDNVSSHKTPEVHKWLLKHPRFEFHLTPTYSAWMNLVERWFAELTTKWIRRGTHTSVKDLQNSINTWIETWNNNPQPFTWHKTADQIFDNLTGYLQRTSKPQH